MSLALQRSAVSFRRQGSSGQIWDDPAAHGVHLKGGALLSPHSSMLPLALSRQTSCALQRNKLQEEEQCGTPQKEDELEFERFLSGTETPKEKATTEKKQPRGGPCGFAAVFGPCMRPQPNRETIEPSNKD